MIKIIFIVLFVASSLCANEARFYTTDGIIKYSDGRQSSKNLFSFPHGIFVYSLFWRKPDTPVIAHIGFKQGSFGHYHHIRPSYFWSPDGVTPYPQPSAVWLNKNPDGSAYAQITLPAFSKNVKGVDSSFTYRFCTLKKYPEWVFLRVTFKGVLSSITFKFDSGWTDFVPPNYQGAKRHLYLNQKNYVINGPKKLPNKELFDSFILYATDSAKRSQDMSVMVFNPDNADLVSIRSMPNSTKAFLFSVRLAKEKQATNDQAMLTFAMGNYTVVDGETAAKNFYNTGENKKIADVLRALNWDDIQVDKAKINTEFVKAEELLSSYNSNEKEKRQQIKVIRKSVNDALKQKNYDMLFCKLRELKKLNSKMTVENIEALLEKN